MKNIIITGTSRGIGYELALQFANAGHKVLAISRKVPQAFIENQNISCLAVDISEEDNLQKVHDFVANTWHSVDVLIHNAGALVNKPFEQITAQEFEYVYKVNVFGVAALNRVVLPFMQKGAM